jgi:serine/threonine protein kinase
MNAYAPTTETCETTKRPGDEPLPGYRLISPLGRGGFGEVWKCEAPGGLHKAIKFVQSDEANHSLRQEFEAFQQIKAIRHPFLLQLERVELTADELIMVMELADTQLQERFLECRAGGLPGIPREELLSYLADAAEALDLISVRHGLQHLDVKPANLFIICGRVKVGDYGLVRAETTGGAVHSRGFTPRYVAPEVLRGRVDPRSDQYSLALVYQELLTGVFPFTGRSAQQMMMAHTTALPDLSSLPMEDQGPVAIALAKEPEKRYSSSLGFVQALMMVGPDAPRHDTIKPNDTAAINAMRVSRVQTASDYLARPNLVTPAPVQATRRTAHDCGSGTSPTPIGKSPPLSPSGTSAPSPQPNLVTPGPKHSSRVDIPNNGGLPVRYGAPPPQFGKSASAYAPPPPQIGSAPIVAPVPRPSAFAPPRSSRECFGAPQAAPSGRSHAFHGTPHESEQAVELVRGRKIQITDAMLKSVLPTNVLTGQAVLPVSATGDWFVNVLMAAAIGEADSLGRTPAGHWVFRFRSTHPISVARHKIEAMKSDDWFDEIVERDATHIVLRRFVAAGLLGRFSGKKAGFELEIAWPTGRDGEVELTGKLFGEPDAKFCCGTAGAMPELFNELCALLKAGDERRKDPRVPVNYAVTLYPLKDDGEVLAPMHARTRNVSAGGICLVINQPLPTRYAYIEFHDIPGVAGLALLTKLIRSQPNGVDHLSAGRFRLNL